MPKRCDLISKLCELSMEELMQLSGTRVAFEDYTSTIMPIRTKEDLDRGWIYSELKDKAYRNSLILSPDGDIPTYNFRHKESFVLSDKLLSFCGDAACIIEPEEDFDNLMKYGQFWFGKSAKMKKGLRSQCHRNSCVLWEKNREIVRICTGYALSSDGLWRVHSWLVKPMPASNQIIETTVERVAYFGFVMDDEAAEEFCYYNL